MSYTDSGQAVSSSSATSYSRCYGLGAWNTNAGSAGRCSGDSNKRIQQDNPTRIAGHPSISLADAHSRCQGVHTIEDVHNAGACPKNARHVAGCSSVT